MAEVIGSLREDRATYGEKVVLEKLKTSLPKEFTIYVECPLVQPARSRGRGEMRRYPDFIVLANYGVVILEVKDWVHIEKADKYGCVVKPRSGQARKERNPVESAREFSILLSEEMKKVPQLLGDKSRLNVPWGYVVALPNQPMSTITQLRRAWGEAFVIGLADLESVNASKSLRATLPFNASLTSKEMELVRGVINPSIIIEPVVKDQKPFLLDKDQERIVAEPVLEAPPAEVAEPEAPEALELFEATPVVEAEEPAELLAVEKEIILNASIRLVRGVAGSGKSLVLLRRAQYLKAQYPEWNITALAFNRALAESMKAFLKGTGVSAVTFHALCSRLLRNITAWKQPFPDAEEWLANHPEKLEDTQEMDARFLYEEIKWIKDMGITSREAYLSSERRGRGIALHTAKREAVYAVYESYQNWLTSEDLYDWADLPLRVLQNMENGGIQTGLYDAILVDEAQDFAPTWITVVKRLLKPEGGLIFLADDPSQSIYRYFSWREKGIPVVGRTRWLRIPYRNTREIHTAAYAVIQDDEILKKSLAAQSGMMLEPDLSSRHLRSGPKPELRIFRNPDQEASFVRAHIEYLLQHDVDARSIAVICRRRSGVAEIEKYLQALNVKAATYHAFKGLEFDHVFLTQIQECCPDERGRSEKRLSEERRLVYMAMTRARNQLYISGSGPLPMLLEPLEAHVEKALT